MQHGDTEQLAQPGVEASLAHPVVLVGDPGEEAADQDATAAYEGHQGLDRRVVRQIEVGDDEQPVAGELGGRVDEVGGDVLVPQGLVPGPYGPGVVEFGGGAAGLLVRPPGVPVQQHPGSGGDLRADRPGQSGQVGAEPLDLLERTAPLAGVGEHPGVELLGALPGLPPLEVADRVGARATACNDHSRFRPRGLGWLTPRQLTGPAACSMSIQGPGPAWERVMSWIMAL